MPANTYDSPDSGTTSGSLPDSHHREARRACLLFNDARYDRPSEMQ